MKTETTYRTKSTSPFSLIFSSHSLGAILNNMEVVMLCNLKNWFHVSRTPCQMDRQNRLRTRGDCLFDQSRIDIVIILYINKDRPCTKQCNATGTGNKRIGNCDDLIARTNANCL